MSKKPHFRRFLDAAPERIHFAAHSHHLWPDVTFDAHMQAWLDAARFADQKWENVFSKVIGPAAEHVARLLGVPSGASVAFAPNTHELFTRILSCLPRTKTARILTTDAEFHSFARQVARLEEDGAVDVTRVPTEPFASFSERFTEQASRGGAWDLVYVSHVFFNSGFAVDRLDAIAAGLPNEALFVIDGYHAFGAVPVALGGLADRAFYLAGGYKYAMSGEGCCFVHAPEGYGARPLDTGWFAEFGALERADARGAVAYAPGGARFYGATFDPTALYRFVAAMDWLDAEGLTPAALHAHAVHLQELFVAELDRADLPLRPEQLVVPITEPRRGQFLTFELPEANAVHQRLLEAQIVTDVRGHRLRFGFGIYLDEDDVHRGIARMSSVLRPQ